MALFGGSPKGFDTKALQTLLEQGAQKQTQLTNEAFAQAAPLTQTFADKQTALGEAFQTGANQRAQTFATGLQNVEGPEFVQRQQAQARKLAFRDLPAAQQNVREQLAATGGLGRGAAIRALSQPVLQAQQNASDQSFQIQQNASARDVQRRTIALDTIFQTGPGAALQKLGIDRNVAQTLMENGRGDLLDRAMRLSGIEAGRTQGLLDVETLRQQQEIAKDSAKRQRNAQLASLAGTVAGSFAGGPGIGGAIGGQIGGQLGGAAAGGAPSGGFDLSGLLTMLALRGQGGNATSSKLASSGQTLQKPIF